LVKQASGATTRVASAPQVEYLADYLAWIGAETIVVEEHYIDRNYIEEVAAYYSRCFHPPPNACTRLHIFSKPFSTRDLQAFQIQAANDRGRSRRAAEVRLSSLYLGFIVVRPIASVPIGRTVLSPSPKRRNSSKSFNCTVSYPVFFLGLRIQVEGVAFQQQDLAVAACATTAIWSALQRVCRHESMRPPTTSRITEEASRHSVPQGRAMPSPGLTAEQMWDALRHFEFAPDFFRATPDPKLFLFQLNLYLRSGIPVILSLNVSPLEGHAITAVGFSPSRKRESSIHEFGDAKIDLVNLDFDTIYVHDDRLGPYSTATLRIEENPETHRDSIYIEIESRDGKKQDALEVVHAAAPLYSKIRTKGVELLLNASLFHPLFSRAVDGEIMEVRLEVYFARAGDYLRSLYLVAAPSRLAAFQRTVSLSRYVGISRWTFFGVPAIDMIWDTTDTGRENHRREHLLGIVALAPEVEDLVDVLANEEMVLAG
jgi:hypothetical protein